MQHACLAVIAQAEQRQHRVKSLRKWKASCWDPREIVSEPGKGMPSDAASRMRLRTPKPASGEPQDCAKFLDHVPARQPRQCVGTVVGCPKPRIRARQPPERIEKTSAERLAQGGRVPIGEDAVRICIDQPLRVLGKMHCEPSMQSPQFWRRMTVYAHQRHHASNRETGADCLRKPRRSKVLGRSPMNIVDALGHRPGCEYTPPERRDNPAQVRKTGVYGNLGPLPFLPDRGGRSPRYR